MPWDSQNVDWKIGSCVDGTIRLIRLIRTLSGRLDVRSISTDINKINIVWVLLKEQSWKMLQANSQGEWWGMRVTLWKIETAILLTVDLYSMDLSTRPSLLNLAFIDYTIWCSLWAFLLCTEKYYNSGNKLSKLSWYCSINVTVNLFMSQQVLEINARKHNWIPKLLYFDFKENHKLSDLIEPWAEMLTYATISLKYKTYCDTTHWIHSRLS